MSDSNARDANYVQSLARGLSVIRAFDAENPERTLSEVARATGLTRAAARRFLLTLVELGYVRSEDGRFALTPRVLELGYAYLSSLTLAEIASPHLERLVAEVQESSSVSVLDGGDIVYVARVAASRIMSVGINVGTRFPAFATSMGRVLLADLDNDQLAEALAQSRLEQFTKRTVTDRAALREVLAKVRAQQWVVVDGELEEGLRSVAVPIRDPQGTAVAAANISAHASRRSLTELRRALLPRLQATAAAIEADLRMTSARSGAPSSG